MLGFLGHPFHVTHREEMIKAIKVIGMNTHKGDGRGPERGKIAKVFCRPMAYV